jgi:demethylsterigmatocystin 6-O-methyltransferase
MHDWPPAACAQILHNQISAMSCKSRIIIIDIILPNKGVSRYPAALDVNMMVTAGMERTERQWHELLEGVGLKILHIRGPQPGGLETDSFIECGIQGLNGHI